MKQHEQKQLQQAERAAREAVGFYTPLTTIAAASQDFSAGERAVLLRALRMYTAQYQQMVGAEHDPKHKEDLRSYIRAADAVAERLQHSPPHAGNDPALRDVLLVLTQRQAQVVHTACKSEMRKRQRAAEKQAFVPAPGRFDSNLMRVSVLEDVLRQLKPQIAET